MKNLVISNSLWNIYNFRYKLIIKLSKISEVIIYCNLDNKNKFKKKFPNNVKIKNLNYSSKSKSIIKNLKLIIFFLKIIKKENPDNLFTFTLKPNLYLGIVNTFFRIPFFPTITGLGTAKNRGGILFFFVALLMKLSFKSSSKIFVHNIEEKRFLKKLGFPKSKTIITQGSGIDLRKYKKLKIIKKNHDKYLFVGRLIADKGIYELIEAFKHFNKFENKKSQLTLAVLVDEDNETSIKLKELKNQIRGFKIIIKKNVKNIKKIYHSHECLILPSYSEGMSRSIMEALSFARPVICSNIHGCKEMVINGYNGFHFIPRSSKSIYKALTKFNNLTFKERLKFGNNSRILLKKNRFDEKYVVSHYLNQLKKNELSSKT